MYNARLLPWIRSFSFAFKTKPRSRRRRSRASHSMAHGSHELMQTATRSMFPQPPAPLAPTGRTIRLRLALVPTQPTRVSQGITVTAGSMDVNGRRTPISLDVAINGCSTLHHANVTDEQEPNASRIQHARFLPLFRLELMLQSDSRSFE